MKRLLDWWYKIALPSRPQATTPSEREQERYARLTAVFLFLYGSISSHLF